MSEYYDGCKLLSLKDINGNTPEIFISTSNRSAGKTTYYSRLLVNRFKKQGKKFGILYRFSYEIPDAHDKFFKDIGTLFFPSDEMTGKPMSRGIYSELFLNGESCGYALAINSADNIKKLSHFFSDIDTLYFDEFQSETDHYCDKEVDKFQSVHASIARGHNKQVRYVPVIMCANAVSLINPYYTAMGISSRLNEETKYLRGDGWVLEQGYNESAAKANETSAFNRAFGASAYQKYARQNVYLNDNKAFIERPEGQSRYVCTLRYEGHNYAIREYREQGIIYCDNRADDTYPRRIAVTTEDHQINYVMLKSETMLIMKLRYLFEHGSFRFRDLKSKEAVLTAISY